MVPLIQEYNIDFLKSLRKHVETGSGKEKIVIKDTDSKYNNKSLFLPNYEFTVQVPDHRVVVD